MDVGVDTVIANRYELGRVLGRGGMSEVRAAHDRRLQRDVAVKLFNAAAWADADGRDRFRAEAQIAASIAHPNVVVIYDAGVQDDTPYLVMECLPGRTLADEIRDGPLPVQRMCQIATEVLDALATAHARGILHRDLKPANVLIAADGRTKLTDFGIATSDSRTDLTGAGMVVGTPAYLAPERIRGERATVRSDIYAVGVMCYEALTGARPFSGDTPIALAYAAEHRSPERVRVRRHDVPPNIDRAVMRAMARRPGDRFAGAADFAGALHAPEVADAAEDATMPLASVTATRAMPVVPAVVPRHRVRRPFLGALVVGALCVLSLIAGAWAFRTSDGQPPLNQTTPPTTRSTTPLPRSLEAPFRDLDHSVRPWRERSPRYYWRR
ncbi:MAG TPA: serine/threonine-protein kinase [Acidimicrobiia bacterium]|nr:serine/threonine-protein kinase [Acidimicrobiia bacterium]